MLGSVYRSVFWYRGAVKGVCEMSPGLLHQEAVVGGVMMGHS